MKKREREREREGGGGGGDLGQENRLDGDTGTAHADCPVWSVSVVDKRRCPDARQACPALLGVTSPPLSPPPPPSSHSPDLFPPPPPPTPPLSLSHQTISPVISQALA